MSAITALSDETAAPARRPARKAVRRSYLAYWLLAPSFALLVLFTYLPVVQALVQSITLEGFGGRFQGYGLGNFQRLFLDNSFRTALTNNILYAIGTIVPSLAIALAVAVALQESSRFNTVIRTLVFFPVLLPLVGAATLFAFVFMPGVGLIDYHLAKLGIRATNWLGNPDLALGSIAFITVWKNAGYYMLFFIAGLQAIPSDLHEAAKIDGANAWTRFWRITLPMLKPTLSFVAVIACINAFTLVDHIIVLTKGGPSDSTNILLNYIFQMAHEQQDMGRASAATIVSVLALLAFSALMIRTIERGSHVDPL